MYYDQKATIRIEDGTTDEIEISRGVRQGCILSPLLFAVYSENIMFRTLEEQSEGIKINGNVINNLRYGNASARYAHGPTNILEALPEGRKRPTEHNADDTVLLADILKDYLGTTIYKDSNSSQEYEAELKCIYENEAFFLQERLEHIELKI